MDRWKPPPRGKDLPTEDGVPMETPKHRFQMVDLIQSLEDGLERQDRYIGGNMFQKFGVFGDYIADRGHPTVADQGRFNVTADEADRAVFKVPSLRNVATTAPYFHDGSAPTLEQAVDVMFQYQLGRMPSEEDKRLIILFLKTLTGQWAGKP
jgi:cytochrome c peroxidase